MGTVGTERTGGRGGIHLADGTRPPGPAGAADAVPGRSDSAGPSRLTDGDRDRAPGAGGTPADRPEGDRVVVADLPSFLAREGSLYAIGSGAGCGERRRNETHGRLLSGYTGT